LAKVNAKNGTNTKMSNYEIMPQISKLTKEAQNTADNINHFPYIGV